MEKTPILIHAMIYLNESYIIITQGNANDFYSRSDRSITFLTTRRIAFTAETNSFLNKSNSTFGHHYPFFFFTRIP